MSSSFNTDFTKGIDHGTFPLSWGSVFSNGSGLTVSSNGGSAGLMEADQNSWSGSGYGTYTFTGSIQGGGYATLWPDNGWPGAELDFAEMDINGDGGAYATQHWKGSDGSNQFATHELGINPSAMNTYSIDWKPGSITEYVNGRQVYSTTSNVPADAAHGGSNESFGFGSIGSGSVHVSSASYTPSNS